MEYRKQGVGVALLGDHLLHHSPSRPPVSSNVCCQENEA